MVRNRRRHKRVSLLKEIELLCSRKEVAKALVINISRSGLVTYCNKPPALGSEIAINLLFVDEYKVDRTEVIIGDVCWVKSLEDFYAVGIQFKSLNEHSHFMTLAYLNYAEGFEHPCLNE